MSLLDYKATLPFREIDFGPTYSVASWSPGCYCFQFTTVRKDDVMISVL